MIRFSKLLSASLLLSLIACHSRVDPGPDLSIVKPKDPLFLLKSPEETGIRFANAIRQDYETNVTTFVNLLNGGGTAVLDVNNDGLQDLYMVSSYGENKLYLNKGKFQFEDISARAGVTAPKGIKTGATVVDINGDGYDDLYVCRQGLKPTEDRRNLLFVNNQDNTFTESAKSYGLDDISSSNMANFFDYDLDGDLDMYLLNFPADFSYTSRIDPKNVNGKPVPNLAPKTPYDSDRLYRNNGDGTFTDVSQKAGIWNFAYGLSVTVSDFNFDHYPDIFVGNDFIQPDILYINNHDGTFHDGINEYTRHTSNHTMGVDIADINNDKLPDLVAVDMASDNNYRQKTLITSMTQSRVSTLEQYGYGHQVMRNVLQLNTGEHGMSDIGCLSGVFQTEWSWAPLLVDFDNDGYKDLYVSNGYRYDVTNSDFVSFTFDSIKKGGPITRERFPDINDFLKLIPSVPLKNYCYRNRGDLTFEDVSNTWMETRPTWSNAGLYADLDNDGDMDLVINNIDEVATVYENKASEKLPNNWLQIKLKGPAGNPHGQGAKIYLKSAHSEQFQEMTNVRGFFSSVESIFHFGFGTDTRVDSIALRWPDGKVQTLTAVKTKQRIVLDHQDAVAGPWEAQTAPSRTWFVPRGGFDYTHRENYYDDFDRERMLPHKLSRLGPCFAQGDVNGDGLEDLYVGNGFNTPGSLYLQQEDGTLNVRPVPAFQQDSVYEDVGAALFDCDGDKDLDLYVVSGGHESEDSKAYQDRLYLNDGKGSFQKASPAILPGDTISSQAVLPIDMDQDGDLDLWIGGRVVPNRWPTFPTSRVLRNEKGYFEDVTNQVAPAFRKIGMVTDLTSADLDGDKISEIIVVGEFLPITVFKQRNGKWEPEAGKQNGLRNTEGWWNTIRAIDWDQDGDLDLIGGNLGLNTRFRPTEDEPLLVYARDFDNNGSIDPIFAWYLRGGCYPLVQKDVMLKQIPSLKKKFVHWEPYGKSTITDVYPDKELKKAQKLEAKLFASCLFVNDGKGRFERKYLPNEAQTAPLKSLVFLDANQDGKTDLFTVGNDLGTEVETYRYDAGNGCLILGDGRGGMKPVSNRTSGLWAVHEARKVVLLKDRQGRETIYVLNNDGKPDVYQRAGG